MTRAQWLLIAAGAAVVALVLLQRTRQQVAQAEAARLQPMRLPSWQAGEW